MLWGSGGIILALLLSFVFWGSPWGLWTNKQAFETYLEEKYGKDFVIDDISFDFFHTRKYHAYAYAKDEPNILSYVGQNRYTGETEDGYEFEVLSYKANEEIGPIIEEYYPNLSNYGVSLMYPETEQKDFIRSDYKEYAKVDVSVSVENIRVNSAISEKEVERAFTLLQALKDNGVPLQHFAISYENRILQLQEEDISKINSLEELGEYLKPYRSN